MTIRPHAHHAQGVAPKGPGISGVLLDTMLASEGGSATGAFDAEPTDRWLMHGFSLSLMPTGMMIGLAYQNVA